MCRKIGCMAVAVFCVLLAACGGDSPERVVERFYDEVGSAQAMTNDEAWARADELLAEYFVAEERDASSTRELIGLMVAMAPYTEYRDMDYAVEASDSDEAMVRVTGTLVMTVQGASQQEDLDMRFPMRLVDGRWRIDAVTVH